MTPFARLGPMVKVANNFPFAPAYQPGRVPPPMPADASGQGAAQPEGGGWGWGDTGLLAGDIALYSNPFTGVPWGIGRGIHSFSQGRPLEAASHLGFGALSFLPGVSSKVRAGTAAATAGTRAAAASTPAATSRIGQLTQPIRSAYNFVTRPLNPLRTGQHLNQPTRRAIGWGGGIPAVGGTVGSLVTGEGRITSGQQSHNAYQTPTGNMHDMFVRQATNHFRQQHPGAYPQQ